MRKTLLTCLLLALAGCVAPRRVSAQFIGYTSPQTTQQTLATNQLCSGSPQTFTPNNLGQTQHYLSIASVTGAQTFTAEIDGIDTGGNIYRISDVLQLAGLTQTRQGSASASGYFPKIQVSVTCSPNTATYTASYSGAWGTFNSQAGSYLSAQIDKINFSQADATVSQQDNQEQTPFGTSAGTLIFSYSSLPASAGSLLVKCSTNGFSNFTTALNVNLARATGPQFFPVGDVVCPFLSVQYSPGTGGTVVQSEYVFTVPGRTVPAYLYTHVTGTTATSAKGTAGFLHTLSVNTAAGGTISIFDLSAANCTGTPSTNTVAVLTLTNQEETFVYDVNLQNGICVKASVAMDFTVSSQ